MTSEQIDRALALFERYVAVQETNSRVSIKLAADREARAERSVKAQEATAVGLTKTMHVTASIAQPPATPSESNVK